MQGTSPNHSSRQRPSGNLAGRTAQRRKQTAQPQNPQTFFKDKTYGKEIGTVGNKKTPNWKNIFFQLEKKFSLTGEFFDTKYAPETTHAPLFRIVKYFLKKTGWARFRKREKYGIPRKVTQGIAAQNLFNFTSTTDSRMYHAIMAAKAL